MRIYLRKNDLSENPKRPYFTLFAVQEKEGEADEFKEVGALWKAKSGNGYTGEFKDGVVIDLSGLKEFKKEGPAKPPVQAAPVEEGD